MWNLDTETDAHAFLSALIPCVRRCLGTHKLQNLLSNTNKEFDAASNAAIELAGIPEDQRRGARSISNVSAALLFFGDCREHCSVLLGFFYVWGTFL